MRWLKTLTCLLAVPVLGQAEDEGEMGLNSFLAKVVAQNEKVQARLMEFEISQKKLGAAEAIFEPELFVQAEYLDDKRENTAEQLRNLGGVSTFKQRNLAYSSGMEMLLKSGAKARIGFDVGYLRNNLQGLRGFDREFTSFFGMSITQPLLKGAGKVATLSAVRVAALESEQAYQEYRRQMMVILAGAEVAYWDLYYAQEQARLYKESLGLAEKVWQDSKEGLEAGKLDELDALTAETTAEERRAEMGQADQAVMEAANQAAAFLSLPLYKIKALSEPLAEDTNHASIQDCLERARGLNPEYRVRSHQIDIERARVRFAKNQRLPQLDLQGKFGTRGLDERIGTSLGEVSGTDFPAWSIGLEFRWPLGGGGKARNELQAAEIRLQQAKMNLREADLQISHEIDNARGRIERTANSLKSYRRTVALNQKLMDSEMESKKVGSGSTRRILEAEAKLLLARNEELRSTLDHQRAKLALRIAMGTTLAERQIDFSRHEVAARTRALSKEGRIDDTDLRDFQKSVQQMFRSVSVSQATSKGLAQAPGLRVSPKASVLHNREGLRQLAQLRREAKAAVLAARRAEPSLLSLAKAAREFFPNIGDEKELLSPVLAKREPLPISAVPPETQEDHSSPAVLARSEESTRPLPQCEDLSPDSSLPVAASFAAWARAETAESPRLAFVPLESFDSTKREALDSPALMEVRREHLARREPVQGLGWSSREDRLSPPIPHEILAQGLSPPAREFTTYFPNTC